MLIRFLFAALLPASLWAAGQWVSIRTVDGKEIEAQIQPRALYRLFERIMPSYADGFDRSLSLIRLKNAMATRMQLPDATLELIAAGGAKSSLPWSSIRTLALRQKTVKRTVQVHSIRHSTQIEFMDTGVVLTAASHLDSTARGFVRLSWNTDSWAS